MGSAQPPAKLGVQFYKYQRDWITDESRFKIWEKSRQIGGSFGTAYAVVRDASATGKDWISLNIGERQALNFIHDAQRHAKALKLLCEYYSFDFWLERDKNWCKGHQVTLPNGARIIALPSNPDSARSFSGNVLLDEFAFHANPKEVWKSVFPVASRGSNKLWILSTHNGKGSFFNQLVTADDKVWKRYRTDIYQAVAQGCPQDIELLRAAINDDEVWQEEFECIPLDSAQDWIPVELITDCESSFATIDMPENFEPRGEVYYGLDIGRTKDKTVHWFNEAMDGLTWTRAVDIQRGATFKEQRERADYWYQKLPVRRGCGDSTAIGKQLCEELHEFYGYRFEPHVFTNELKEDMAVSIKKKFEERIIRIPYSRTIRSAFHSIKKYNLPSGKVRFDAERSSMGHADEFWACALADLAASKPSMIIDYRTAGRRRRAAEIRTAY